MKEPTWKIWLSYLAEIHIESATSDYNPHLYVSLRRGRYQLSTANAIYSFGDLYSNFDRAFQRIDLEQIPGKRVLILGFGLGSIPILLEQKMGLQLNYTVVEIDEAVLDLANRYTLPDLQSGIQTICADAAAFVAQCSETFDLICMDIFLDDVVPSAFESAAFLQQLKELLAPGGVLLYNRLAAKAKDIDKTYNFYQHQFCSFFPDGTYLDVGGNWMLLNRRDVLRPDEAKEFTI